MLPNLWIFILSIILIVASIVFKSKDSNTIATCTLLLGAFFIRLFVAHLDPFLNDWDERYHALVARNLMDNPLKPYLRSPILSYDYTNWTNNYIWLHKQPLFLWQMALSMKIFGVSEYAIRYPDVLMGTIMVLLVYRITILLTKNNNTAFIAALFMAVSNYQLDLISGHKGMDHNDVAFGFYILLSFWAYTEYINKRSLHWAILVGIFAGCAILNKWLTGLLVFSGWGINFLLNLKKETWRQELLHIVLALICCIVIFLPWQLYIFHTYPAEANFEYTYNTRHISEALEGHIGNESYYLRNFDFYFGFCFFWLPVGLMSIFFNKAYSRKILVSLISAFLLTFLFFSLVVHTKVDSYFFVVVPVGFIIMASGLSWLSLRIKPSTTLLLTLSFITAFFILNGFQIFETRASDNAERQNKIYNTTVYKNLRKILPPGIDIVMNVNGGEDIECTFYNKGITAYSWCHSQTQIDTIKNQHLHIACFQERYMYPIPDFIRRDTSTYIIKTPLK